MTDFVSEEITPVGGGFDAAAMAQAEPGLPRAFRWRGAVYDIAARLGKWKATAPEGGRAGGNVYLRRHYYQLRMTDGACWTVYFTRQTPKSGSPKARWFLYTIEPKTPDSAPPTEPRP